MTDRHPLLDELLDGRLNAEERAGYEEHLAGCERCRAELAALRAMRELLRQTSETTEVPPEVTEQVRTALDRETTAAPAAPRRWLFGTVAGLGAAAAIVILVMLLRPAASEPVEAARDYRRIAAAAVPLEFQTGDPAELERWFTSRVDFPTRVFDFAMMRVQLTGGRVDDIGGNRSAAFAYRTETGAVVVCQMYRGKVEDLPPAIERRVNNDIEFFIYEEDGVHVIFWQEGEVVCVLTSDMPREEAIALALAKAMKPAPQA